MTTGLLIGVVIGFASGLVTRKQVRRLRLPDVRRLLSCRRRGYSVIDLRLTQSELDEIYRRSAESDFENRREALGQQLGQYADDLASGDPALRERLRRFEQGAVS